MSEKHELMKLAEAAKRLSVNVRTIRRYIHKGILKAQKLPGGHYRISEQAVKECNRGG